MSSRYQIRPIRRPLVPMSGSGILSGLLGSIPVAGPILGSLPPFQMMSMLGLGKRKRKCGCKKRKSRK